jgi:hypothetical protein
MNQSKFAQAMGELTKLESWDIASVLGSWQFVLSRAALNQAIRLIPDLPPEGSGIEAASQYGEDLRKIMNGDVPSELEALVAMNIEINEALDNYANVPSRSFEDTYQYLRGQAPKQNTFINDYNMRKRQGIKMNVSLRDFVNGEMQQALRNYQVLLAKGQDAVALLDKIAESGPSLGDGPEWLEETLFQRAVAKLQERYTRLEIRRTNPRVNTAQRDEAAASQVLIAKTIGYFGGTIIIDENFNSDDDDAAFLKENGLDNLTATTPSTAS